MLHECCVAASALAQLRSHKIHPREILSKNQWNYQYSLLLQNLEIPFETIFYYYFNQTKILMRLNGYWTVIGAAKT
jgi:hypothetical protein